MEQSRLESKIEATLNIFTGFIVSYMVWMWLVPIFWPHLVSSAATNFWVVSLFTVTSWLRSYYWRRFFATGVHRAIHNWLTMRRIT